MILFIEAGSTISISDKIIYIVLELGTIIVSINLLKAQTQRDRKPGRLLFLVWFVTLRLFIFLTFLPLPLILMHFTILASAELRRLFY